MTWPRVLDFVQQDVGYAGRSIRRAPGFASLVAIALALGIGVNTATFAVLDELYLRPPAGVSDPGTLRRVWIEHFNPGVAEPFFAVQSMSYPVFRTIAQTTEGAATLAAVARADELQVGREPRGPTISGAHASANFFGVVGVRAGRGRVYSSEEDRFGDAAPVAVVSHAFWINHLEGDSAVIGRPVIIDGKEYVVIGVLERGFRGVDLEPVDVWLPLGGLSISVPGGGGWWDSPNHSPVGAVARLSAPALENELQRRASRGVRELLRTHGRSDTVQTVLTGSIIETHNPRAPAQEIEIAKRLSGVAAIVLVIACANVINLLVARAIRRRREIAVRLALGVSRWRLVRLLTTETFIITAIAGLAALLAGWWASGLLRTLVMPDLEPADGSLHVRVVAFTIAIALLAGVVSGLVPALRASKADLTTALKERGRRSSSNRSWLRDGLVVAQAALSVVLLVAAGLFVRSLGNVEELKTGYDAERLVFGTVQFARGERPPTPALAARMRELAAGLESMPGIEAVARVDMQPMEGYSRRNLYVGADSAESFAHYVSASFFRATGTRIERGRGFTGADVRGSPNEIVVNDAVSRRFWPNGDAIGQCIRFQFADAPCRTVVGIVENARIFEIIESEAFVQVYLPVGDTIRSERAGATLIVRTDPRDKVRVLAELRSALLQAFPTAEPQVRAMTDFLEPQYRPWRLGATLFTALGLLALVVAVVGIYSTVSYGVSQRTQEFGVRIALGARTSDVIRHVLDHGLRTVAIGVVIGIGLALGASRLVTALLYGVAPNDPGVLAVIAAALLSTAALAAVLPAWRAARVDPVSALRTE